jgi:hypothetical protein
MPPRQSERQVGKCRELWKRVEVMVFDSVRPLLLVVAEHFLNQISGNSLADLGYSVTIRFFKT